MTTFASETIAEVEVSLVVIRCACGAPENHLESVCPQGVEEDLGVLPAYSTPQTKGFLKAMRNKLKGT